MNETTHRSISEAVVYMITRQQHTAAVAGEFASYPDEVDDIGVKDVGIEFAGRAFCSLSHFCVPAGPRSFRGYNWSLDKSLQPVRGVSLTLPKRDVYCVTDGWWRFVGIKQCEQHPLACLVRDLKGKGTLAADDFTFPTAASMADWLAKSCRRPGAALLGCLLHFAQDAVVYHHSAGVLLNGHASWEGALQEAWHTTGDANKDRWLQAASRSTVVQEPRTVVEQTARLSAQARVGEPIVFARAIKASAIVVRWWMGRQ
jgi:hypothetical protein